MPQVLTNVHQLAICPAGSPFDDAGLVRDAALAWNDPGRVIFAGRAADLPSDLHSSPTIDAQGATVIPGLVDCHTHLAFAGWRADEFTLRCKGADYAEIAARGGGILRTVTATRAASEDELVERSRGFLAVMLRLGATTVECKSGYGLTLDDELKLLRVYRRLRADFPGTLVSTFLGSHVVPPEFRDDRAAYVRLVCEQMIPRIAGEKLAAFCDVFVEHGAFTPDEARQISSAAKPHGLRPKLHADQLADGGGAALAAEVGAISADHLEFASDDGLRAMAAAGVVAVLLPFASLYLNKPPLDARRCFALDVPVAVATDFNPGSAPSYHLPFAMTLACTMNRMTPAQALRGAAIVAARAVGLEHEVGSLEPGKRADFALLDAESVEHWLYHLRPNAVVGVYTAGRRVV
ncbi:MAG TPA: imidazolonepropionase [Gemmataceae bacterium]|jgi:imidazolonepropionase|nr:imidazolonepropionase [Gemmataceae bacterium]